MKIVINRCWGGFNLSYKAVMRYAELSGIKLYPFTSYRGKFGRLDPHKFVPCDGRENWFSISYSKSPLKEDGTYEEGSYFSPREVERTDPVLIRVIEELGNEANGNYSELKIVDIPDDVRFEIDDYDGMESIHEIHRAWS